MEREYTAQRSRQRRRKEPPKIPFRFILFMPLSIFYLELITKIFGFEETYFLGSIFTMFFSLSIGLLFSLICSFFSPKTNRRIALISLIVLAVYFSFHFVYKDFFETFFSLVTTGEAGNFTQFLGESILATIQNIHVVILYFVPAIIFGLWGKKQFPCYKLPGGAKIIIAVVMTVVHLFNFLCITIVGSDYISYYKDFTMSTTGEEIVGNFGLLTRQRLEIQQLLFGSGDILDDGGATSLGGQDEPSNEQTPIVYEPNVMNIDFNSLIANEEDKNIKQMHEYFSSLTPTLKNEYTGMFKDKNLIFLTLEGFSYKVIDPTLTPTLYKMSTQGFVFNNFYTSMWGGSTATGEYAATTGNFYNSANCLRLSGDNLLPFTMGNQFKKLGYTTLAYHNNTYTYYGRDKSHPNMGYTYKATDNGLVLPSNVWPRSDNEMAQATLPDFINQDKFHVYYMTVSGHANYTFAGNRMSVKHKARVQNLPYSENVKAYIACQLEVEDMLTTLVNELEKAGKLDDTVFAMSADHYPYALSNSECAELYGMSEEGLVSNFDLYKNSFILWSSSMAEPIVIDEPCSAIDIIPTLSTLFGLEYDSRLLMGQDILSNAVPLVVLNCNSGGGSWHWITDKGSYNTKTKTFTPADGITMTEDEQKEYVKTVNSVVSKKRTYSLRILDKDYYRYVFK